MTVFEVLPRTLPRMRMFRMPGIPVTVSSSRSVIRPPRTIVSPQQFLCAQGWYFVSGDYLAANDVVVYLGDLEGDFFIGIDQGDHFQFENDVPEFDIGDNGTGKSVVYTSSGGKG